MLLFSLTSHSCLLSHLSSVLMICMKISKAAVGLDKDVIFVAVYIPSYQSPYYKQTDTNCSIHHLEDFLLNLYQTGEDAYLMVCADLNARIGEWGFLTDDETDLLGNEIGRDSTRKSQDKNTDQFGKGVDTFLRNVSLHSTEWKPQWRCGRVFYLYI